MSSSVEIVVGEDGTARAIYDDALVPLLEEGTATTVRASHVEPDSDGTWYADLGPSGGPVLRGFKTRTAALEAEVKWLKKEKGL